MRCLGLVFYALLLECCCVRNAGEGRRGASGLLGLVLHCAGLLLALWADVVVGVGLDGTVVHCKL